MTYEQFHKFEENVQQTFKATWGLTWGSVNKDQLCPMAGQTAMLSTGHTCRGGGSTAGRDLHCILQDEFSAPHTCSIHLEAAIVFHGSSWISSYRCLTWAVTQFLHPYPTCSVLCITPSSQSTQRSSGLFNSLKNNIADFFFADKGLSLPAVGSAFPTDPHSLPC